MVQISRRPVMDRKFAHISGNAAIILGSVNSAGNSPSEAVTERAGHSRQLQGMHDGMVRLLGCSKVNIGADQFHWTRD